MKFFSLGSPARFFRTLAVGGVLAAAGALAAESTKRPQRPQFYVKRDTWPETMLATRAECLKLRNEQGNGPGAAAKPFESGLIRGDGPAQHVSVSVAGMRRVRLVTLVAGANGTLHIWGEAKLVAKDGSETPLSKLQPISVSVGWGQLCTDRNWQNQPLQVADKQFPHGLWVHGNSDLCYALDGKYERLDTWIGIDKARASGTARFQVLFDSPDLVPAAWRQIAADFPKQAAWMSHEFRRENFLDWFRQGGGTQLEQRMIQQELSLIASGGESLRKEFADLRRVKAPAHDPRWLALYARACRYRECSEPAQRLWIVELRAACQRRIEELASTPAEDPRWNECEAAITRAAAALGTATNCSLSSLRPSIENLAQALPGRFPARAALLQRLGAQEGRFHEVVAGLSRGDAQALASAASLRDEVQALRRALLLSLRGMSEFLGAWSRVDLAQEWEQQFETLTRDLANRAQFDRVAAETHRREALILESDRDPADVVLRRTAALLADLKRTAAAAKLAALEQELTELQAANPQVKLDNAEARYVLFADACRVRREIALNNPLLNFDQIVFIKRHRALMNHMCDQYYGMAATPGGGLYVLGGAFGPQAQVRDVLADAVVERGRLRGRKLSGGPSAPPAVSFDGMGNRRGEDGPGGSFLAPDLSYDGRSILFAFVECQGDMLHRHHTDPTQGHWAEGRCYHVFRVGVDGTHLEQLTDGTWNDFDPCWLPNGRIALISERRGGYLRCGRVCPTYTLYDMAADGSDINCLSFHETNEWNPSVTHDGRIIYTRWDYVDRYGCTAHHPWITTLDGRDSRAVHGNFAPRSSRPDMELDVRAVPGSQRYVATAAPHHGQAFGSLVLVDPRVEDDDAMAPVKRITPDVGFPESQGGAEAYGTPWPLSEDYFLCAYDADMAPRQRAGPWDWRRHTGRGEYGLYLVDAFGNQELLYRDPAIACQNPIPLRATPRPPAPPEVIASAAHVNPAAQPASALRPAEATLSLINVYQSLKPWPDGTKIQALRVLQVLPMTVPSGSSCCPHDTAVRTEGARDSVVPVRYVLGTVPVEADGSAHFVVPANKEMFFQAVDQRGLAVQSMRSATYLHAGEHLVCQGCHEPRHQSPPLPSVLPLALRRGPSRLLPDVDGSNPFSYPRLVQPVLDRLCADCHAKESQKTFSLSKEPLVGHWYASYANLAPKYGFHDYGSPVTTTPGRFGAQASKLLEVLQRGHYGVQLSPDDFHRITLWLDCSSLFYGVYEKEGGEAQLRGEIVRPTLE